MNEILVFAAFLTVHTTQSWEQISIEGCQLQCNIQLRASPFSAKIWNERFNVIAECVWAVASWAEDRHVQPLSRSLLDSATLLSSHLFKQKHCCCFNLENVPKLASRRLMQQPGHWRHCPIFNFSSCSLMCLNGATDCSVSEEFQLNLIYIMRHLSSVHPFICAGV